MPLPAARSRRWGNHAHAAGRIEDLHHAYSLLPIGRNGTSNGVEGFIFDITEKKRVNAAAMEVSEQRYRALFENHIVGCALHK